MTSTGLDGWHECVPKPYLQLCGTDLCQSSRRKHNKSQSRDEVMDNLRSGTWSRRARLYNDSSKASPGTSYRRHRPMRRLYSASSPRSTSAVGMSGARRSHATRAPTATASTRTRALVACLAQESGWRFMRLGTVREPWSCPGHELVPVVAPVVFHARPAGIESAIPDVVFLPALPAHQPGVPGHGAQVFRRAWCGCFEAWR